MYWWGCAVNIRSTQQTEAHHVGPHTTQAVLQSRNETLISKNTQASLLTILFVEFWGVGGFASWIFEIDVSKSACHLEP